VLQSPRCKSLLYQQYPNPWFHMYANSQQHIYLQSYAEFV
jgi:hypothetical protein